MTICAGTNGRRWLVATASLIVMITSAIADDLAWQNRFEPVDGITTSGQPDENSLNALADSGYAAVIDLRTDGEDRGLEEQVVVEGLGMDYVHLPIAGRGAINFENAERLDEILSQYDKPVLVHCGSGNRAGALLALREEMNGAEAEDALAFGRSAGMTSLEDTVKERIAEK
jgi:uncharacterized protein (TIGR01244 family)